MLDRVLSARIREYAPANPVEQENVSRAATGMTSCGMSRARRGLI